jgi:hypothetical protein
VDLASSGVIVVGILGVDDIATDGSAGVDAVKSWAACSISWPHKGVTVVPDEAGEDRG